MPTTATLTRTLPTRTMPTRTLPTKWTFRAVGTVAA